VAATGAAVTLYPPGPGGIGHADAPVVTLPMPPVRDAAATAEPGLVPVAMLSSPEPPATRGEGPPVALDPALIEPTALGDLPRIAPDGTTALRHYARRLAVGCRRPCLAVVVTGLGLAQEPTARALGLPPVVGLSFSPYTPGLPGWQARARAAGHEVLLELPLQPRHFPADDSGPLTIPLAGSAEVLEQALLEVLATGGGYPAVAAPAGAFAAEPARFAPLARALQARGLGFVELGGDGLGAVAAEAVLAHAAALVPAEGEPATAPVIERMLAAAESEALAAGRALLAVPPGPLALERLRTWLGTLPGKGIVPVPPATLLGGARVESSQR
jgi:polysaccharide deacetylase 2 family uncharacterized protein YibQ